MARLAYFAVGVLRLTFSGVVAPISTIMTWPSRPNWPAPRSLHWPALLTARAIENQRMWRDAIASAAMATAAIIAVTAGS